MDAPTFPNRASSGQGGHSLTGRRQESQPVRAFCFELGEFRSSEDTGWKTSHRLLRVQFCRSESVGSPSYCRRTECLPRCLEKCRNCHHTSSLAAESSGVTRPLVRGSLANYEGVGKPPVSTFRSNACISPVR